MVLLSAACAVRRPAPPPPAQAQDPYELAAAAGLVMGQGAEGIPVALIRGVTSIDPQDSVKGLLRKPGEDLFR